MSYRIADLLTNILCIALVLAAIVYRVSREIQATHRTPAPASSPYIQPHHH